MNDIGLCRYPEEGATVNDVHGMSGDDSFMGIVNIPGFADVWSLHPDFHVPNVCSCILRDLRFLPYCRFLYFATAGVNTDDKLHYIRWRCPRGFSCYRVSCRPVRCTCNNIARHSRSCCPISVPTIASASVAKCEQYRTVPIFNRTVFSRSVGFEGRNQDKHMPWFSLC